MFRKHFIIIYSLVLAFFSHVVFAQDTLKLMPLGDSITRGSGDDIYDAGFRRILFFALKSQGYNLNFVGSYSQGDTSGGFDDDHESDSGLHTNYYIPRIQDLLNENPPQFMTFHLGTNDIAAGNTPSQVVSEIDSVLNEIDVWEAEPGHNKITVFLAQILNRSEGTDTAYINRTSELNQLIATLAANRIANGDRIVVVNIETGASIDYEIDSTNPYTSGDMNDGYHPNFSGHTKMGNKFFSAIQTYLAPTLSLPANNQLNVSLTPTIKWFKKNEVGVTNYRLQVATSTNFADSTLVLNDSTLTDTTKSVSNLKSYTKYFWRVKTKFKGVWSEYSGTWSFTTVPLYVKAKVYLQGPFLTSTSRMDSALNTLSLLPSSQSYDTLPWNYTGLENFSFGSPNNYVDWVLLELRSSTTAGSTVARHAAILRSDGTIVDTNNTSQVAFSGLSFGNYYLVIKHRNHLAIMSSTALSLSDTSAVYNFTDSLSKAFGTEAMADLGAGRFAMWGGDVNGDGTIKYNGGSNDRGLIYSRIGAGNINVKVDGYFVEDVNLTGKVVYNGSDTGRPANDRSLIYVNIGAGDINDTKSTQVP